MRLHLWSDDAASAILEVEGFDSDLSPEIAFSLNGNPYGGIPIGPNNAWTTPYQLYLPGTDLIVGDNTLDIIPFNPAYKWGIRFNGIINGTAELGYFGSGTPSTQYGAAFLVPVFGADRTIDFTFYDIGLNEVQIFENSSPMGYVTETGAGLWGSVTPFGYIADQMVTLDFDNPGGSIWGVKVTNWQ
jgi:hypothetical protein